MSTLFPIERAAIEAIIEEHPGFRDALRRQLAQARVTSRTNTGAGFYTDLEICGDAPTIETRSPIGEPFAEVDGLKFGMGFLLMVKHGKMLCLEGYSFESGPRIDFETVRFRMVQRPFAMTVFHPTSSKSDRPAATHCGRNTPYSE
jgi:hypothetical protein